MKICRLLLLMASLLLLPLSVAAQFTTVSATVRDPAGISYSNGSFVATLINGGGTPKFGSGQVFPQTIPGFFNSFGFFTTELADNTQITPAGTQWSFFITNRDRTVNFTCVITISGASMDLTTTLQGCAAYLSYPLSTSYINTPQTGSANPIRIGDLWYPGATAGIATPPIQAPFCQEDNSTAPTSFNTESLAAGTYYAVFFLLNKNGATPASPVSTGVTVAGPTDKILCRPVSYEYAHGTYALGLGMSTSPTGPFYLQTPARVQLAIANNGVTYDGSGTITVTFGSAHPFWYTGPITISGATGCVTDPNGAYVVNAPPPSSTTLTVAKAGGAETCGGASAVAYYDPGMAVGSQFSGAAKFIYAGNVGASDFIVTNLVTSGDVPPTINTATIDALQVAVNQTLTLSGSANVRPSRVGRVALRANTTYTQTTPLVCFSCLLEGQTGPWFTGGTSSGTSGTPLITSSWNDASVGTVMLMGQQSQLLRVNVTATGTSNGIMYVQGDHSGNGSYLFGVAASTLSTSTTTAAIRMYKMGVSQDHRWDAVSTTGGDVNVWLGNANVSLLEWTDGRANCNPAVATSSAIRHTAGPVDIYRGGKGISDPVSSAVTMRVRRLPMEGCKGIGVDFGGGYLALEENTHVADAAPTAGTVAGLRLWSDNWSSGTGAGGFKLSDGATVGHSGFANGAIYFGPGANDYGINGVSFENTAIAPNSGGVSIDGGNNFGRSITLINTSGITCDPNASTGKIVNITVNAFRCYSMGSRPSSGADLAQGVDRYRLCTNGAATSCNTFESAAGVLNIYGSDNTTIVAGTTHPTNGNWSVRGASIADRANNPAASGTGFRTSNTGGFHVRNAANSADVILLQGDSSNRLQLCRTNCAGAIVGNLNSVLTVDGATYTSVGAALTALGTSAGIIFVPSTYNGAESNLTLRTGQFIICASQEGSTLTFSGSGPHIGAGGAGVQSRWGVIGCKIRRASGTSETAFLTKRMWHGVIKNNVFENFAVGIDADGTTDGTYFNTFQGNHFNNVTTAISANGGSGHSSNANYAIRNVIRGANKGIDGATGGVVQGWTIEGNDIEDMAGVTPFGIEWDGDNTTIQTNWVEEGTIANATGIYVRGAGNYLANNKYPMTGPTPTTLNIDQGAHTILEPNLNRYEIWSATVATLSVGRFRATGTALVAGDFALHANWGTNAVVSAVEGTDQGVCVIVFSGTAATGANPTLTLTPKNGTWTNTPPGVAYKASNASVAAGLNEWFYNYFLSSATALRFDFAGTPNISTQYAMCFIVMGR